MKKNKKTFIIGLIVTDVIIAVCFFLTYGPFSYLRDFLITTSMTTMTHKYLARTFYSEEMINKSLSQNTISSFNEGTNTDEIKIGKEVTVFASEYEKQILEREKNQLYKLIEFEHKGYPCYLIAIYDPSRVSVGTTAYMGVSGQYLVDISKRYDAKVAINGGGFSDPGGNGNGGVPMGAVISDGKILSGEPDAVDQMVAMNNDNILVLKNMSPNQAIKEGVRDSVSFGPYLIVNGVSATISGNGGWGINPRTVIAQRKDGIILFLVVDGNGQKYNWNGRGGLTLNETIEILEKYGAYNAANMDGGASTTLVIENKLYNKPCGYGETGERRMPNGWILK